MTSESTSSTTTTETTDEFESLNLCDGCLSVPLVVLALSIEPPIGGWRAMLDSQGIRVLIDPAGREAISTLAARKLLTARRRRGELALEDAQRRNEEIAAKYPRRVRSIPAVVNDGALASPYESLIAAEGGVVTPEQEFGLGRDKPRFLEEMLASSARELAERKRRAAERKQQLVDKMRDDLR